MKNTIRFFGIIALVTVIGFSFAACDNGNGDNGNNGGNGSGGYKWSSWYTIVLSSGISGAQFILDDDPPHSLEVEIQGGTPASFTLSSHGSKDVLTPSPGGTLQYRYRASGFGIQANTISGPVVRFKWLGEFAAQK
jgi:hypothetical protein